MRQATVTRVDPSCPGCGYNLRGLPSDRCPECGLAVDRYAPPVDVPWQHRGRIGRWRAFRRTVWRATVHPRRLGRQAAANPQLADARRFQNVCATIAFLPMATAVAWLWLGSNPDDLFNLMFFWDVGRDASGGQPFTGWWTNFRFWKAYPQSYTPRPWWSRARHPADAVWLLSCLAGLLLFARAWAGLAQRWFAPRRLPERARDGALAVGGYAAAGLIWTPLTVAAFVGYALAAVHDARPGATGPALGPRVWPYAVGMLVVHLGAWCVTSAAMMRGATGCGRARAVVMMLCTALALPVTAVLTAYAVPAAFAFLAFVYLSWR